VVATPGQKIRVHQRIIARDRPEKFVLYVGSPEEGPPPGIRHSIRGGGGLGRAAQAFPAAAVTVSTRDGVIPTTIHYRVTLPDLAPPPGADVVVVPLRVPAGGDLLLADPSWSPKTAGAESHVWTRPAVVVVRDLPAGDYEVRITATGRNELHEELEVIVYPWHRPKFRVLQVASKFARSLTKGANSP
jgi:hypothetical protein